MTLATGKFSRLRAHFPVLLLLCAIPACGGRIKAHTSESAVPVVIRKVTQLRQAATVPASGTLEARLSSDLAFQVGGRVDDVRIREGDRVIAGTILARLDSTDYRLDLDRAQAAADRALDEYTRSKTIYESGSLPAGDWVRVQTSYRQTVAQRDLAAKQLSDTRLTAPFTGVISRRALDPGEQIAPGVSIITLMNMDPMEAKIGVPENEIDGVKVGQSADILVSAIPDRTFSGTVTLVGVAADPAARTYTVKISVSNRERTLLHGMVAEARIRLDQIINAVTIPGEAIVRDPNGATLIYVYSSTDQRAYARRVDVGTVRGREVEIARGLSAEEWVVIGGQARLRDGTLVVATTAQDSSAGASPPPGRARRP